MKTAALLLLLATPTVAQNYAVRTTDLVATQNVLFDMILDRDLEFFDGGVSRYGADGTYSWTYSAENGGGVWSGTYAYSDDATICIAFDSGQARCDQFVINERGLVILTEDGQRYPLREIR